MKTLSGEREIEYAWVDRCLKKGPGLLLDLGPDRACKVAKKAIKLNWQVVGIGTDHIAIPSPEHLVFIHSDFLEYDCGEMHFDCVLAISSIEHFGLAGRYGVLINNPDLDMLAMDKLLHLTDKLIMTIPIGREEIWGAWHRVYGERRLSQLLIGWNILKERYWAKLTKANTYEPVSRAVAVDQLSTIEPFYYAVGTFVLEPKK